MDPTIWGERCHHSPQLLKTSLSLGYTEGGRAGLSFHSQMSYEWHHCGSILTRGFFSTSSQDPPLNQESDRWLPETLGRNYLFSVKSLLHSQLAGVFQLKYPVILGRLHSLEFATINPKHIQSDYGSTIPFHFKATLHIH